MTPEPGIHRDVPFEDYAAWDAINSGVIKWGSVSPKHMRAALEGKCQSDDTKDKKFGRAVHCRLLEPDRYKSEFLVSKPCNTPIASGKREGHPCGNTGKYTDGQNWYCGQHRTPDMTEPTDYISDTEAKNIEAIAKSVHEHEVMKLFARPGWSEASIVFDFNGLRIKGRCDRYCETGPVIIDIKKTQVGKADTDTCKKAIYNYGWHRQAALYIKGVERLTGEKPAFWWVFIEEGEPFDINAFPIDEDSRRIGWFQCWQTLEAWKRATATERYHGYIYDPRVIKPAGVPDYVKKAFFDAVAPDEVAEII